jgi:hypothetical protein
MRAIRFKIPFLTSSIPHCSEEYWIKIDNDITVVKGNETIHPDENQEYSITIHNQRIRKPLRWLVAFTYIPLFESQTFASTWGVGFKTKSDGSIHQNNLYWIPPKGGTPCPENPEFFVIPGYSRHGVSVDGRIFARHTGNVLFLRDSTTKVANPYKLATCWSDFGSKNAVLVHRQMGLALLEYPEPPDNMTIDHLNGIKADNRLENLEWVTYAENNIRAMNLGLRKARIPIIVRDYVTKRDYWYRSISDASIAIGCNSGCVHKHTTMAYPPLIDGRYRVRVEGIEFPETEVFEQIVVGEAKKDCIGRNIFTNEVFVCSNEYELASICGMKARRIRSQMCKVGSWPYKGWLVRRADYAGDLMRKYSVDELGLLKTDERITDLFLVTDLKTDEAVLYPSLVAACRTLLASEPQNLDFMSFKTVKRQVIIRNGEKYLFEIIEHKLEV